MTNLASVTLETATRALLFVWLAVPLLQANAQQTSFADLFDGNSLSGWKGRPHFDPRTENGLDAADLTAKQKSWNDDRDQHWRVEDGVIVSDGKGVFLTTEKDYGDFELTLDWKMMTPGGDSGIYLRGSPQVQIWDPANEEAFKHGADKGSGALWNNNNDNPGKWPLVVADNPIGHWNTFRVRMIGSRVWVWLNGQKTVDGSIMDNYWDRSIPIFPSGCIQLQTHGSEMRFRDIRIREIGPDEANHILAHFDAGRFPVDI